MATAECLAASDGTDGYVYFIAAEGVPRIKIGWSRTLANARARARHLEIGSPVRLGLVTLMPGSQRDERKMHRRFAHLRDRGEWFVSDDELRAFVLGLPRRL